MYRPPYSSDSDSDDEYGGFSFDPDSDTPNKNRIVWVRDPQDEQDTGLFSAVVSGDLKYIEKIVNEAEKFDLNRSLKGGLTLLHHACKFGRIDMVQYLLDNGANPNRQVDSITPLMEACSCIVNSKVTLAIVRLMVAHGSVINISDKMGTSPLMYACMNANTEVVKFLVENNAALEAVDNQGWTAIFHAIEKNQAQIVKILVDAKATIDIADNKGYTPRQVAQFHGFGDILNVLPPEEYLFYVPPSFMTYNSLRDLIPRIFLKSNIPEYFQEVTSILQNIRLEEFLKEFALNSVSLADFLPITDERLKEIGIKLPLHRKKILLGLLYFHLHNWSKKSIARVKRSQPDTFYDILMMTANHLKNLVIVNSAIVFVYQNLKAGEFGRVDSERVEQLKQSAKQYRKGLYEVQKLARYLQKFSPPKPPLYIDYDDYVKNKRKSEITKYFHVTFAVGISIVYCLKASKII